MDFVLFHNKLVELTRKIAWQRYEIGLHDLGLDFCTFCPWLFF